MRAAFVEVPLRVTLSDVDAPPLGAEDVRVDVQVCGICGTDVHFAFDANEFHFQRLQLRATHSIPNLRFPMAIDLLARGAIESDDFVTHRFPLSRAVEAMETAARDKENVIKLIVDCANCEE